MAKNQIQIQRNNSRESDSVYVVTAEYPSQEHLFFGRCAR